MNLLFLLTIALPCYACAFLTLRHAVHMYQLNSYQNQSYRPYLGKHRRELFAVKRVLPCVVMLLGFTSVSSYPFFFLSGGLLFVLINRPKPAKKPLVYTARVKRLLACAAVLLGLWLFLSQYVYYCLLYAGLNAASAGMIYMGLLFQVLAPVLAILLQPWLVMLYNDLMGPVELLISRKYQNQAKAILQSMPDLKIIGITGSYGKTSTKYFLERLLSVRYQVYMTPGNYNTTLGVTRAVREGLKPIHQVFLCEMGARHKGDIKDICKLVHPTMGVITSVGPQHLETFGSMEIVLSTKLELADAVKDQGPVFLNFDSPRLRDHSYDQEIISYGINGQDYTLSNLYIDENGSRFSIHAPDGSRQDFSTRLLGSANVQNLCAAIAVSHTMGISLSALVPAVRQLESVPHRLQLLRSAGMTIIDDAYNSNPEGAKNALETLALCHGQRIVITPGLVELGAQELDYNRELGRQVYDRADWLITVGEQDRTAAIREGAKSAGLHRDRVLSCATVEEAMAQARALPGDAKMVLLLNDLTDNY